MRSYGVGIPSPAGEQIAHPNPASSTYLDIPAFGFKQLAIIMIDASTAKVTTVQCTGSSFKVAGFVNAQESGGIQGGVDFDTNSSQNGIPAVKIHDGMLISGQSWSTQLRITISAADAALNGAGSKLQITYWTDSPEDRLLILG